MGKVYKQFKRWVGQEKIQKVLNLSLVGIVGLFVVFLIVANATGLVLPFVGHKTKLLPTITIPTLLPSPVATATPIATLTPVPQYQTNTDPVVHCMLHECGTIDMPSSQCHLSGCCVIGSQNIVMTDQNKCTQEQQAYAQTHQIPAQQTNNNNVQQQYDQIKQQEQSSNEQYLYNQCANNVNDQIKSCDNGCQSTLNQDNNICYSAYAAPNAYEGVSTDKYNECLSEVTAKYQSCLSSCDANQTTDLQNCSTQAIQQSGVGK